MRIRVLPVVVLALTIFLAGCTGGVVPGDGAPTSTTTTSGDPPDDLVADDPASTVREAGSVTVEWTFRTVDEDGTVSSGTWTNAVDFAEERSLFTITSDDEDAGDIQQFYADDTSYMRFGSDDDEPFYAVSEGEFDQDNWLGASHAYDVDDFEGLDDLGTETFDGTTVRTYETTDAGFWWWTGGYGGSSDEERVESFVYTVKVDDDGLVRYEAWSVTTVDDARQNETVEWEYSVTGVGSTVIEDPDWLADAIAQGQDGSEN